MMMQDGEFELVLFDLDGTLVDTAPDMVAALQSMQQAFGLNPIDYSVGRNFVSNGAAGLLSLGFPLADEEELQDLTEDYLERYTQRLCDKTRVFEDIDTLLDDLDDAGILWGVVTNKPEFLTNPLLEQLGLIARSCCAISGDTLPVRKPDPAPLLLASDLAGVAPGRTLYIGDAERDIEAGRRAGMATIAAGYGYITEDTDPREWDPDLIVMTTSELSESVRGAVGIAAR